MVAGFDTGITAGFATAGFEAFGFWLVAAAGCEPSGFPGGPASARGEAVLPAFWVRAWGFAWFAAAAPGFGVGVSGLSGTEGNRCARISAARADVAPFASDGSRSCFWVMTSTSSNFDRSASGAISAA